MLIEGGMCVFWRRRVRDLDFFFLGEVIEEGGNGERNVYNVGKK